MVFGFSFVFIQGNIHCWSYELFDMATNKLDTDYYINSSFMVHSTLLHIVASLFFFLINYKAIKYDNFLRKPKNFSLKGFCSQLT